ncbi:WYL domain-containing protein [Methylosinus sp. Sm6]|uniref:WYL domain-containing protein n=1 Tax=Methylosinus sp. Sm6 TaxID=2866948 RepID=UPI001C99E6A8|nr:WYL domain-containing protein [Methylosinus sp. Sm6]MBY6239840.1 WYL domain-containing protein [Methylosinus sp. Sm6]
MASQDIGEKASRLAEAIENGEFLRIRYHGGTQPGTVREIRPAAVDANSCRAYDLTASSARMFLLKYVEIVGCDEPVTYRKDKIKRRRVSDIFSNKRDARNVFVKHTDDWAFNVTTVFAASLDIELSIGMSKDKMTKKKHTFHFVTVGVPPEYAFIPGDIFYYPRDAANKNWGAVPFIWSLQVSESNTTSDDVEFTATRYRKASVDRQQIGLILGGAAFARLLQFGPTTDEWPNVFGELPSELIVSPPTLEDAE